MMKITMMFPLVPRVLAQLLRSLPPLALVEAETPTLLSHPRLFVPLGKVPETWLLVSKTMMTAIMLVHQVHKRSLPRNAELDKAPELPLHSQVLGSRFSFLHSEGPAIVRPGNLLHVGRKIDGLRVLFGLSEGVFDVTCCNSVLMLAKD